MSNPPRMLLLSGGGAEAFVQLPVTYEKALAAAQDKFQIPTSTHIVRLSCRADQMPYIGGYAATQDIFLTDNDSYHYACAGKHVVRLDVHAFDKNAPAPGGGGGGGGEIAAQVAAVPAGNGGKATSNGAPAAAAQQSLSCEMTNGKTVTLTSALSGDLSKGPGAGEYLGTLRIEPTTFNQSFQGRQLGPNEVLTKFAIHDKNTARLLFRPRSIRPQINMLFPEERSLEVNLSISNDWTITSAYPMTSLYPEGGDRQRMRWFLKVLPGGAVEDLLSGTQAGGLFVEMLPVTKPRPAIQSDSDPFVPAWPNITPTNAWCLPQTIFIPHIDRVLATLGLPVESRSSMITGWLPALTRHKNIAYKILGPEQLSPSTTLHMIPAPDVLVRIFVVFKGVPDGQMKEWETRGLVHAEMGLDWTGVVGWSPQVYDEELFRVFEYGAMEVFD